MQNKLRAFVSRPLYDARVLLSKDKRYPKLSVVTPSFNQGAYLERTILSVLNQNYPNLEYIIVDGGSDDESVEIIKKYEKYIAYWVSEKDVGQSNAINKGFGMASGVLIGWQNSDDIYLPGVFLKVASLFLRTKCDLIMGDIMRIDEEDSPLRSIRYGPWPKFGLKNVRMLIANQASFWTTDLNKRCGSLREDLHYSFDVDYFYRLTSVAKKIMHTADVLGCLRSQPLAKANHVDNYKKELEYVETLHRFRRNKLLLDVLEKTLKAAYLISRGNYLYLISPRKDAFDIIHNLQGI